MVDDVLKKYPEDVKVVIKDFPLSFHKQARLAAQYVLASRKQGGDEKYKELYHKVFESFYQESKELKHFFKKKFSPGI